MRIDTFSTDFVYSEKLTQEYKTVHIKLGLNNGSGELTIFSNEYIALDDLNYIVKSIKSDILRKIRINIPKDCIIVLDVNGEKRKAIVDENIGEVAGFCEY